MNVVHLSTHDRGGAGYAALRLHKGLSLKGVNSKFLTLNVSNHGINEVYGVPFKLSFQSRLLNRFLPISKQDRNYSKLELLQGEYEKFSFAEFDNTKLHEHPFIQSADIINLHWIADWLDYPSFFRFCRKPIVWTLHDMNPFMGGFHYKEDEIRNRSKFAKLDRRIFHIKEMSYANSTLAKIVTPSQWLLREAEKSKLMAPIPGSCISNSVDTEIFRPFDKKLSREVLGLSKNKRIVLFVAESSSIPRKGFALLSGAIKELSHIEDLLLVAIGSVPDKKIENVQYLGRIGDQRLMALAYSAADVFVLPSREDNLPNVMLEALSCGTPVISTPVGGMVEVIEDGVNGVLAKDLSVEGMKEGLLTFFRTLGNFDTGKIRSQSENAFSLSRQASSYISLYKDILNRDGY